MTRRQVIRVYLTASLRKRLWMALVPAIALGISTFIVTSSLKLTVLVALVMALCVAAGILWSSYRRHLDLGDFPTDRKAAVDDAFIPDD